MKRVIQILVTKSPEIAIKYSRLTSIYITRKQKTDKQTNKNVLGGGCAVIASDASLGLPSPAALTAFTWNSYWLPSSSLGAVQVVSLIGERVTGTHFEVPASRFSTM